ncbi:unnamed protein product [Arctia plantaginis]|uniref:Uncharacterized protein n=1 Tax=Arctia plantaginis TaxID=874455 RepID=A0A8S1AGT6_ARCPL|nr:unnamed protein product [Arctia plantaginis]CAB3249063.1 unnamed protein product [Arctia plantaginis]
MAPLARGGRKSSAARGDSNGDFLWHCGDQIDGGTATALPHSAVEPCRATRVGGGLRGEEDAGACVRRARAHRRAHNNIA